MPLLARIICWSLPLTVACGAQTRRSTSASLGMGSASAVGVRTDSAFARLVNQLSEPGGYFDSDNLISNETSYLHVLDAMRRLGVRGGAYVGVGPDQNFSYIAAIRPTIAYVVDIRRDNLLEHLLFKALFAMSRTRVEYLSLLVGRRAPPANSEASAWSGRSIQELVDYVDRTPVDSALVAATQEQIRARVSHFGLPLSPIDLETIGRIRMAFVSDSLGIRYSSLNRSPRPYHPTYRQLLLEKDRAGEQANYLASEDRYQFLRSLEARDLVVPVVGNLAGDKALVAIGKHVMERGEKVSAFYLSNVEQYLMRDGAFARFAQNLGQLPRDEKTVLIRSYFGYPYGNAHPLNVPGHFSTSLVQTAASFLAEYSSGTLRTYFDLVGRNYLDPQ